jgi:ribosomal protein S18 acetylase RimI-like enzyme
MIKTEVISLDDLHNSFKRIRDLKEGFVTNFFLNPSVSSIWIRHKLLTLVSINKTDFLLRNDKDFAHLYYCSTSELSMISDLSEFMTCNGDKVFTVDLLGNEAGIKFITDLFLKNGFYNYTSLVRMTRKKPQSTRSPFTKRSDVEKAQDLDLMQINTLLHEYFDCYSDQLPHVDELKNWMNKGSIIICKSENDIQGFLIFEDIGFTSYMKYWLVHPHYREKKIGSTLINAFFHETQTATRHLFWVNRTNDNAIKRYMHYGFLAEDMIDIILINRQIEYGRQNN